MITKDVRRGRQRFASGARTSVIAISTHWQFRVGVEFYLLVLYPCRYFPPVARRLRRGRSLPPLFHPRACRRADLGISRCVESRHALFSAIKVSFVMSRGTNATSCPYLLEERVAVQSAMIDEFRISVQLVSAIRAYRVGIV